MLILSIYIGFCILGIILGSMAKKKKINISWSSKIQTVMLIILLFTMGARLGVNKDVVSKLGSIGFNSVILTIFILAGSIIATTLTRKALRIDKKGERH